MIIGSGVEEEQQDGSGEDDQSSADGQSTGGNGSEASGEAGLPPT